MVDVRSNFCRLCHLFQVRQKADLCWTCRTGQEKVQRHELAIKALLEGHPCIPVRFYSAHDRTHPCARGLDADKIRPDFIWELLDRVVVLEVDEEEHRMYNVDERARLHKLHELAGKPLTLVRFNPDASLRSLGLDAKRRHGEDDTGVNVKKYSWLLSLVELIITHQIIPNEVTSVIVERGNGPPPAADKPSPRSGKRASDGKPMEDVANAAVTMLEKIGEILEDFKSSRRGRSRSPSSKYGHRSEISRSRSPRRSGGARARRVTRGGSRSLYLSGTPLPYSIFPIWGNRPHQQTSSTFRSTTRTARSLLERRGSTRPTWYGVVADQPFYRSMFFHFSSVIPLVNVEDTF